MFESWRAGDEAREQTDAAVAVLQRELLAPVDHDVRDAHLEAMALELAVSRASFTRDDRRPHRVRRAVVSSAVVAGALTFMSGLGAAGALPAPAQHWLSGVTRVFGIHLPDRPSRVLGASDEKGPAGAARVPAQAPASAPSGRLPHAPAPLHTGRGSVPSASGAHPNVAAVVGGPGDPLVAPTPTAETSGSGPDPTRIATVGSNAGGNGTAAAEPGNTAAPGRAGGNGKAATAHANKPPQSNAGGNGKSTAHANHAGNANAGRGSAGSTIAKPGTSHRSS